MTHVRIPITKYHEQWSIGELIEWLAKFGQTKEGGITRLLYSKEWQQAQKFVQNKMMLAGLKTYCDSVGNLFGRITGSENPNEVILTGSHIDTVVQGGKYDGAYGILASLIAVKRLLSTYGLPKKTIEVVSLCEEEGSRFPLTYWGSKNIVGEYDLSNIEGVVDSDNISFKDAMKQAGFPIESYQVPKRSDIAHFVEIHIEQGQILEKQKQQIGIVTHIVGQQRYKIKIFGQSNHAGTTEMDGRKDAMVGAANAITYLAKLAKEKYDSNFRATVGKIQAKPNVSNVIAGEVSFTIDIRHHDALVIHQFVQDMNKILEKVDEMDNVSHSIELFASDEPVLLDVKMQQVALKLAKKRGLKAIKMVSGAGHDSQVFAKHIPTTLLFVPSQNGISHSPLEFTKVEELENGIKILQDVLYYLAYKGGSSDEF